MENLLGPTALAALIGLGGLGATPARANPQALPFTATSDPVPPGTMDIQQTADLVPLRAVGPSGEERYLATALQTEVTIGLHDSFDLTLAITLVPESSQYAATARFEDVGNGLRQRLRYVHGAPGDLPLDFAVIAELTENERAIEIEGRMVAQLTRDRFKIVGNVGGELAFFHAGSRSSAFTPSLGASYEISAKVSVGVDSWLRWVAPTNPTPAMRTFVHGPHIYAGPTLLVDFGKLWWSAACYGRVTDRAHDLAPGEPYGRIWVRTMFGFDL